MNSENSRAVAARWAGAAALTGLASVVVVQAGAIIIAGPRVSGTSDADEIGAYFAHPSLQWVYMAPRPAFLLSTGPIHGRIGPFDCSKWSG